MRAVLFLIAIAFVALSAPAARAQTAADGRTLFDANCDRCHGPAHPDKNLVERVDYAFGTFESRVRFPITEDMPRFPESRLSDTQVCSIYLYIRTQQPGWTAGDDPCGLRPPAPAGMPVAAPTTIAPGLPPEPPLSAIEARRFLFDAPAGDTYVLDCWGGNYTDVFAEPSTRGLWRYEVRMRFYVPRAIRTGTAPWQPGECVWAGLAPPRSAPTDSGRLVLDWTSRDPTPFTNFELGFPGGEPSAAFTTGGAQTDYAQILHAVASPYQRIRFLVSDVRRQRGASGNLLMRVHGFAVARTR